MRHVWVLGLHYLRPVVAHLALGKPIPAPGDQNASKDPVLYGEYWQGFQKSKPLMYQHVIFHSDAEGY
jgi:hypothetical protein